MKKLLLKMLTVLGTLTGCALAPQADARGPVWKVSKDGSHVFIGGTIHVLTEADYPLPAGFDRAYQSASQVYFETDVLALGSPRSQAMFAGKLHYPDGQSLRDKLSDETWSALRGYFEKRNLSFSQANSMRPGALLSLLLSVELQRLNVTASGVDYHYAQRAVQDNKHVGRFESIEQQADFIAQLGAGDPDRFVRYLLDDLGSLEQQFHHMRVAWRAGDADQLHSAAGIGEMKEHFPRVYRMLLQDRNNAWMPQLLKLFETDAVELVLVGALHLTGEDGLLSQLQSRGFIVEQLE